MNSTLRDGAAGRLETSLPKAWQDQIWATYRSVVVFGNVLDPVWFQPSEDGSIQGVIVARRALDVLRFLCVVDPLIAQSPRAGGGAE